MIGKSVSYILLLFCQTSFFTLIFWYPNTKICRAEKNSFINSGVTHKCKWAQIIISEFMKEDWDNKDSWDVKLLWNGGLREFQLGLQSLRALKDGRNKLSKRIRCTVGESLDYEYYYLLSTFSIINMN